MTLKRKEEDIAFFQVMYEGGILKTSASLYEDRNTVPFIRLEQEGVASASEDVATDVIVLPVAMLRELVQRLEVQ